MSSHFCVGLQILCCSDPKTQQDILAQIMFLYSSSTEHSAMYSSQPFHPLWAARAGNGSQHRILGYLSWLSQQPSAFTGNLLCPLVPSPQQKETLTVCSPGRPRPGDMEAGEAGGPLDTCLAHFSTSPPLGSTPHPSMAL